MSRVQKFNNVELFKRADLSPYCDGKWGGFMEDEYYLEVKDGKGRMGSNNPFAKGIFSSWCKLKVVKDLPKTKKKVFRLSVNGQYVFFKLAIAMPKGHYYGK